MIDVVRLDVVRLARDPGAAAGRIPTGGKNHSPGVPGVPLVPLAAVPGTHDIGQVIGVLLPGKNPDRKFKCSTGELPGTHDIGQVIGVVLPGKNPDRKFKPVLHRGTAANII